MTTFKVYEIYNEIGTIYYVGCTKDMSKRKKEHERNGRYGTFHVVREFPEEKLNVALYYEAYLKYVHGLNDYIKPEKSTYNTKVKGGNSTGQLFIEKQIGFFDPKNKQKCVDGGKKGNQVVKEKYSEPVKVYAKNGQFVGEYYSQHEAAREMTKLFGCQVNQAGISMVLRGKGKTYKGHIFKRS